MDFRRFDKNLQITYNHATAIILSHFGRNKRMKEYTTELLRNIALVGHGSSGKTMFAEAMLHYTGATTRLGKIEDGTTASDYDEEEIRRKISLYTSVVPVEYRDCKINFLDAPGYTDFVGEVVSALSVADGAVLFVDAVAGVEVGTEIAWRYCDEFNLPRFIVINKMDRENADFNKAYASVEEFVQAMGKRVIKVQLPWGEKLNFKGVIDVISSKAYEGASKDGVEIPAEFTDAIHDLRMTLIEDAAEGEDALLEKYLESGELTYEETMRGLKDVVLNGSFVPVFVSAAGHEKGIAPIMNTIIDLMPCPAEHPAITAHLAKGGDEELIESDAGPVVAYVWKTTADPFVGKQTYFRVISGTVSADAHLMNAKKNADERMANPHIMRGKDQFAVKVVHAGDIASVAKLSVTATGDTLAEKNHLVTIDPPKYPNALYRVAIQPKTQADAAKISGTLTRLCEEDMTLSWYNERATNQTILQGMGEQHIDVAVRRAGTKFQVNLVIAEPKVPYREGITRKASAQYRHKKQSGGAGQFGEVHLRIEPLPEAEFEFTDELVGMNLSRSYLAPIEKSIRATMEHGVIAGYTMSNVKVIVYDGKEHPVDSKPIAFETAGREAFKIAVQEAGPVLFEPIYNVHITVPDAHMGDVMSDLNTRRGRVQGTESDRGSTVVIAHVPLAEMLKYTTQLRSFTGGRGHFTMEFDHYETVPSHLASGIIEAHKKELEKTAAKEE
jgi:elongation factor G